MTRQTSSESRLTPPQPHVLGAVRKRVAQWFSTHARDLPWRQPGTSPWGVLVSEVMSQQTPMSRVAPRWLSWMATWPTPRDLAAAPTAEVLLAWDTLGYPRRALRLRECATAIAADYGNRVPDTLAELEALPGVGNYTAAAVMSFAHGRPATVLDVNIRRVLSRVFAGVEHPKAALGRQEQAWATGLVPRADHVTWNAGLMELGALVCTSRNPACADCPIAEQCAWLAAGRPAAEPARKPKTQAWEGTDRQLRGAIMAALRQSAGEAQGGGIAADLFTASAAEFDPDQLELYSPDVARKVMRVRDLGDSQRIARLLTDLAADGLTVRSGERIALP